MENTDKNLPKKYDEIKGPSNQVEIDIIMSIKKAVDKAVETVMHFSFNEKPVIERKQVIDWQGRMRIVKPPDCAFVSLITLRRQKARIWHFSVHGFIVIYIPEDTAYTILRCYGIVGEMKESDVRDGCGEFLNNIAGLFKRTMVSLGYEELEISTPHNFGFHVDELIDYRENFKFEVIFNHEEKKFLHIDIALSQIRKV